MTSEITPEEALEKAVSIIGSMQVLAEELGVTKGAVGQWKLEGRKIPAEHCPVIERLVNRAVSCEQLRPDVDWAYLRDTANASIEKSQPIDRDLAATRKPQSASKVTT